MSKMVVFKNKQIRRVFHQDQWWFVIVDIVAVLTDSVEPANYIRNMRRRDPELNKRWGQIVTPVLVETPGGEQKPTLRTFLG